MIRYTLLPAEPLAHRLHIRCEIPHPEAGQILRLPTWIAGSYLIREYARHVVSIHAEQEGQACPIQKLDKQSWQCQNKVDQPLTVLLQVHAWDLSVRGAHFDSQHAFINPCAVFPEVLGQGDQPCEIHLAAPDWPNAPAWSLFTRLPGAELQPQLPARLRSAHYSELLDHPIEMGATDLYSVIPFSVGEVPHRLILRGAGDVHVRRLQTDLQKVCSTVIALFGPTPPFAAYDFLTTLTGDGYGGLEHRNSTALLAARSDLPPSHFPDDQPPDEGYTRFLGLCAHEYFHAWNVKRLTDAQLIASDGRHEAYTELLWFFEGFTSYYDDLSLVRSGVIDEAAYLKLLEKTVQQVEHPAGQHRQSVAESSFDAWIKYYRPDDNTPNSVVSYYAKGSLIALVLDARLRQQELTLDSWMQTLWAQFGETGVPLTPQTFFDSLARFAGEATAEQLKDWAYARSPLPLANALAFLGVNVQSEPLKGASAWGLRTQHEQGLVRITHVLDGLRGQTSGLSAGDILISIGGERLSPANLDVQLDRVGPLAGTDLYLFREDRLKICHSSTMDESPQQLRLTSHNYNFGSTHPVRQAWLAAKTKIEMPTNPHQI